MGNYGKHGDFLYDSTDLIIWTTVETCTGIIAACLPCLKPLFKAILPGSSYVNTYGHESKSGYMQHGSSQHHTQSGGQSGNHGQPVFEMYNNGKNGKRNGTTTITALRKDKLDPDNASEESFLPLRPMEVDNRIRKTTKSRYNRIRLGMQSL